MFTEQEIIETLQDAGCTPKEINQIVDCCQKGERKKTEKLIAACRRHQLERLHESQQCIDRLDFLSYKLEKTDKKEDKDADSSKSNI